MLSDKLILSIDDGNKRINLFSLIFPMLMQSIFSNICGTINTIVLSGYSDLAVNASSVANEIFNIGSVLIGMISTGTVIITSIQLGAKNTKNAGAITCTGTVAVFALSSIIAGIEFILARKFMTMMNLSGETLALAISYSQIRAVFIPVGSVSSYFSSILICNGYPKYTLIVGTAGSVLNLIVSYAAINAGVFDSFMTPIARVALFSGLLGFFTLSMTLLVFLKKKCPFKLGFKWEYACQIVKLGSAGVMMSFMWRMAQTITTSFVADMGDAIMNTKIYISNIISYIPLVCYAISSATSVFMGRLKGSGEAEKQKRLYRQNVSLALCCNLLLSLIVLALHRPLMHFFTDNESIINAATIIFVLDILVEIPRAINNVSERSLNSNGDVKTTFITSLISCWLGSVALAYVFCIVLDLGLVGMWLAFIIDESFKSVVYILRWRSGKWQYVKV